MNLVVKHQSGRKNTNADVVFKPCNCYCGCCRVTAVTDWGLDLARSAVDGCFRYSQHESKPSSAGARIMESINMLSNLWVAEDMMFKVVKLATQC